jgi:hypothetical protein
VRIDPAEGEIKPVPQGRACTVDIVPDDDRVTVPTNAMFAFLMLATTPGGDAYIRWPNSTRSLERLASGRRPPAPFDRRHRP